MNLTESQPGQVGGWAESLGDLHLLIKRKERKEGMKVAKENFKFVVAISFSFSPSPLSGRCLWNARKKN